MCKLFNIAMTAGTSGSQPHRGVFCVEAAATESCVQ